jgi:hypothetical protein
VTNVEWRERAQFFALAAQIMRRILVDAARARGSRRRDGIPAKVNLEESVVLSPSLDRSILALDEALTAFSRVAPRQAQVVELRLFRRVDGERNRRSSKNFAADHQARLGSRQGIGVKPFRFNKMVAEQDALYDVMTFVFGDGINRGDVPLELAGQLVVTIPTDEPRPLNVERSWLVEIQGTTEGYNGFGAPIQVPLSSSRQVCWLPQRVRRSRLRRLGWVVIRLWEHQVEAEPERCVERVAQTVCRREAVG